MNGITLPPNRSKSGHSGSLSIQLPRSGKQEPRSQARNPRSPRESFVTQESDQGNEAKRRYGPETAEDRERRERDILTSDVLAGLRDLQDELARIDKGYHKGLYQILANAYEDAETLNENRSDWVRFCREAFWAKCTKKPEESDDRDAIILWVLRFIFRAVSTTGTQYNRAYKHARTLQGYAREDVPSEEVAEKLAKEGADYAFRRETKENPRQTKGQGGSKKGQSRGSASGSGESGGEHTPQRGKGHGEEGPVPTRGGKGPPAAPKQASASSTVSADTKTARTQALSVEVTEAELEAIIEAIKKGERPRITLERAKGPPNGPSDWVRVRAYKVEYP